MHIAAFIPLLLWFLLFGLIIGLVLKPIAKRKGRSKWAWFFIGFVPFVNGLAALWLASLADRAILEKVEELTKELQNLRSMQNQSQFTFSSEESEG
jgi:energy-coupling factor transporter transmembrane protein EcfT